MSLDRSRISRRDAIRLLGTSALVAPVALRAGRRDVAAAAGWCYRDPIFSLDGKVGHIYVAVELGNEVYSKSQIEVVILHPRDAVTEMIWVDPIGFGHGIAASFKADARLVKSSAGCPIEVRVKVPMTDPMIPVLVLYAPAPGHRVTSQALGRANSWVVLSGVVVS